MTIFTFHNSSRRSLIARECNGALNFFGENMIQKMSECISNTVFNDNLVEAMLFKHISFPIFGQLVCIFASKTLLRHLRTSMSSKNALFKLTKFGAVFIHYYESLYHFILPLRVQGPSNWCDGVPCKLKHIPLLERMWSNNVKVLCDLEAMKSFQLPTGWVCTSWKCFQCCQNLLRFNP